MTTTCRTDEATARPEPFLYNPYEVALCGAPSPKNAELFTQLITGMFSEYRVGVVGNVMGARDRSANLCITEGHERTLIYPSNDDAILTPRPLLDADFVLVDSDTDIPMPKLVWIEKGEPEICDNALGYILPQSRCAILPEGARWFSETDVEAIGGCIHHAFYKQKMQLPLNGLVLAGGYSTRMQRDKAGLEYYHCTQVSRAYELLQHYCRKVYVSLRAEQADDELYSPFSQIHDVYLDMGPLGGILSALRHNPNAAWLVLGCDLPFVDLDTLKHLVVLRDPFKLATAYTSPHSGFPEPLCAIYEPKSVHRLLSFVAYGWRCPRKALINSDTCLLELVDKRALDNINTPEQYEATLKAVQATSRTATE